MFRVCRGRGPQKTPDGRPAPSIAASRRWGATRILSSHGGGISWSPWKSLCVHSTLLARLLFHRVSALDPGWYSGIFPFTLAWFMAGALAYHAYVRLRPRCGEPDVKRYAIAATLALALLAAAYPWLPFARPLYLCAEAVCLPGVVLLGRSNPLDKALGDLSYPIYLVHPLFMIFILPTKQIVPVVLSIALAYLLTVLLEKPLDLYRHRAFRRIRRNRSMIQTRVAAIAQSAKRFSSAQTRRVCAEIMP